jgi:flagellar motor switch protein FliM
VKDHDVLSNDEVAALVAAARGGDVQATAEPRSRRRKRIREIDFSRPTKFTQEQQRRLERAHDSFCRLAATRLAAELRLPIELQVIGIDQITWSSAIADIPEPSLSAIVETKPLETTVLMSVEMALAARLIDRILGGAGAAKPRQTELTEIELMLARRIFVGLLDQLSATWQELAGLSLELLELETKAANVHLAPPSEPTLRLQIELKIERFSSTIALNIPYRAIEPIASQLTGGQFGDKSPDRESRDRMRSAVAAVDVDLIAEAASIQLPVETIVALEAGSIIPLGPPKPATLYVGGVPMYRVQPGRSGTRRAVEVLSQVREEER